MSAPRRSEGIKPVTATEVEQVVLRAIASSFGKRPLTVFVATRGLELAAFSVRMAHLREVAAASKKGSRT